MKVAFLWKCHPVYLQQFRAGSPDLKVLGFEDHRARLLDDHYAWPMDLCGHMSTLGIDSQFFVGNDEALQKKWATAHAFESWQDDDWQYTIVVEQLRRLRPDILIVTYSADYCQVLLQAVRPYVGKIAMWMGLPFSRNVDTRGVSILLTEHPHTLRDQQDRFDRVLVTPPGFNPSILDAVGPQERRYDVTFVGQLTRMHQTRMALLSYLLVNGVKLRLRVFVSGGHIADRGELLGAARAAMRAGDTTQFMQLVGRVVWPKRHNRSVLNVRDHAMGPVAAAPVRSDTPEA